MGSKAPRLKRKRSEAANRVHGNEDVFFKKQRFQPLHHNMVIFQHGKFVCHGSSRESLLLDMHSAELFHFFKAFLIEYKHLAAEKILPIDEQATQPWGEPDQPQDELHLELNFDKITPIILSELVHFVADHFKAANEKMVDKMIAQFCSLPTDQPFYKVKHKVPLSLFIEERRGSCRHQVLALAYLLATLQNYLPEQKGDIYRFREDLYPIQGTSTAAHAIVVYRANDKCYMLDPTRKLVVDLATIASPVIMREMQKKYPIYDSEKFLKEINQVYVEHEMELQHYTRFNA
jgi:hypothetical protein